MSSQSPDRAIISYGPHASGGWHLRPVSVRPLREKEVLVEMVASGICQTDLHFAGIESGAGVHYPRVMGHEGSGYVRALGPNTSTTAKPGDPVLLSFSACQDCETCTHGHPAYCSRFNDINFDADDANRVFRDTTIPNTSSETYPVYGQFFGQSSFASLSIVHEDSIINVAGCVKTRDELRLLAPLGCGVQTGAGTILNAAGATAADRVVVMGLGGVGLSAVAGAKIAGCKQIIGLDRFDERLELARALGATHTVNTAAVADSGQSLVDVVREVTGGLGATVTLDTTGVPALVREGLRMTALKGRVLQVGVTPEEACLEIPIFEFMTTGKSFMGVIEGDVVPREFVPRLVKWVREGVLPLEKLVRYYPAEEFETAVKDMKSGRTVKPVLVW